MGTEAGWVPLVATILGATQQASSRQAASREAAAQRDALAALAKKTVNMPDPDAQERARRRSISMQLARRGRASTILTGGGDAGGGGTGASDNLG